jgi:hypothetical protein
MVLIKKATQDKEVFYVCLNPSMTPWQAFLLSLVICYFLSPSLWDPPNPSFCWVTRSQIQFDLQPHRICQVPTNLKPIHVQRCVIEPKVEVPSTLDPKSYNPNFASKNPSGLLPLLTNAFVIEHILTQLLMDPSMVWCLVEGINLSTWLSIIRCHGKHSKLWDLTMFLPPINHKARNFKIFSQELHDVWIECLKYCAMASTNLLG